MVDPVPIIVIRAALALLFAVSALQKLRAPAAFADAVREYRLLPARLALPFAAGLMVLELGLGIGAFMGNATALLGIVALLLLYSVAIAINLRRGRVDIDCGCGGARHGRPLSLWLLVRNGGLAALGVLALLPVVPRPLGLLDAFAIGAALIVASALYAASENLAGMSPRLRTLQRG